MRKNSGKIIALAITAILVTTAKASANAEFDALYNAINTDTSTPRSFTASGIMNATSGLGSMAGASGSELTLNGGLFTLDGAAVQNGLTVGTGLILNLNNFGSKNPDGTVNTSIRSFTRPLGGAALINNGTTTINNTVISGNYTTGNAMHGGAIYNTGGLNIDNSTFTNNRTGGTNGHGGAIYNTGGTVVIDHSTFNQNYTGDNSGGAIFNDGGGDFTVRNSTFYQNSTNYGGGGAIMQAAGTLTVENCTFRENRNNQSNYGGAIASFGTANIKNSRFYGNQSPGNAGAIAVRAGTTTISGSTFGGFAAGEANYGGAGGVIYAYAGSTVIINGSEGTNYFRNNTTGTRGGAIFNLGTITISDAMFDSNSTATNGGAIDNSGLLTISNSTFQNNKAVANNGGGAAIMNWNNVLKVSDTKFINNEANSFAGAIYNGHTTAAITRIQNSEFTGNKITNAASTNGGGAIYNNLGRVTIINTKFENNTTASLYGGAIFNHNGGIIDIIADNGSSSFTGNKAAGASNAIYLNSYNDAHTATTNSQLNLNAGNGGTITFNDKIESSHIINNIKINNTGVKGFDGVTDAPTDGTITFNETVSNATIHLYNGTMKLGVDNLLNGNNILFHGGTVDMMNNAIGTLQANNLTLNGVTNVKIDADLSAQTVDKIASTFPLAGTGTLNISQVKVINDATSASTSVNFIDSSLGGKVTLSATEALTPIYKYGITYDNTTGNLSFARSAIGGNQSQNFNPAALAPPVASLAGVYVNQTTVYNEALGRMDALMMLPETDRLLMRYRNKTASANGEFVFSPLLLPEESAGTWVKNFTSFENVPLNNGPNVSSVGYGMLVGKDSALRHLGNGFDGYLTAYMGYNGSHQNYDQVGVYQNGGVLGLTGTVYKGKFFSALTANVGASGGTSYNMYGTDNFATLMAGIASKTGYNFEIADGKFIIQPSFMMSYTFANTFDYQTASGVNITSNPLNAIQIMPGVKFIANLKNGWQPYLAANMVWNIMDSQRFYANDVQLPMMSVNPYLEYGLGVQRRWGDRFTGFGQVMARGGGRNGVAMQFGFRWAFAKSDFTNIK